MAVYIHEFPIFFAKSIFPDGCSTFIAFHAFQKFCEKLYDKAFLFFSFACLSAGELDNALSPLTLNQCQPRRPTNQSVRPQSQTTHKQSPTNQEPRHNLVERASVKPVVETLVWLGNSTSSRTEISSICMTPFRLQIWKRVQKNKSQDPISNSRF